MNKRLIRGVLILAFAAGLAGGSLAAADIRFGFSLSGGIGNIDGGDFNRNIRDYNTWVADYEDYWDEHSYSIDWKEMKWLPKFGGEFNVRFGRYFGVGLGAEYIRKTNPGTIGNAYEDSMTVYHTGYYEVFSESYQSTDTISQTMTVVPVTLSLYGFLPLGRQAEAYLKAGVGYYFGKITSSMDSEGGYTYNDNFYWNNGVPYPPHLHQVVTGTSQSTWEATSSAVGFHFGVGFDINLTPSIAVFGEAFYRLVNFKEWKGSSAGEMEMVQTWGWTDSTQPTNLPNTSTLSLNDDFEGQLWFYEDIWEDFDTEAYGYIDLFEDEPEENDWTKNIRPAEINLNGFAFKVGIRIFFGSTGR